MSELTIQPFTPACIEAVDNLQTVYKNTFPGVKVVPAGFYLSPAFHGGEDVFCAFAGGQLVAYAPCYVQLNDGPIQFPHRIWVDIKAYPGLINSTAVKDRLLERLFQCARERLEEGNRSTDSRPAQVIFEYLTTQLEDIAYVTSCGFNYSESVFAMSRDLTCLPLPQVRPPTQPVTIQRWKMKTEAEQQAYVDARNECFPESPLRLEEWQYFMCSPMWSEATMIAAFDRDRLIGCASVYWNEEENQLSGARAGFIEDIFVLSGWRGCGIAAAMIAEGLGYLKEHGLSEAHLMVRALNENALELYRRLGYEVTAESRFYFRNL